MAAYKAGVCNINAGEIAKRRRYGYVNVAITILYAWWLWYSHWPLPFQLFIFFPVFGSILSFWQARQKFCAGFALASMYENEKGEIRRVEQSSQQQRDQWRAFKMVVGVGAVSIAVTSAALIAFLAL